MSRDVISRKLFKKIVDHPRVKPMREQSVRDAISTIHKQNPGITMNAAAHLFAERKDFGVYRYLSHDDKLSLQHRRTPTPEEPKSVKPRARTVKVKEVKADFASPFISGANDNAKAYPYVYILENTLRDVIFEKFGKGSEWWNDPTIVKKDIQEYATRIREAETKYPWMKERGDHPMWYVGLLELFKIIEKHWKPHFREVFIDLEQLRAWIKESVPIRNVIAHNIITRNQERDLIEKNTDYICRLVEKWRRKTAESKASS